MSRLIDADALYEEMQDGIKLEAYDKPFDYLAEILDAPTVDAVEVVRCRNCEHWGKIIHLNGFGCTLHEMGMLPSGYCSYGERKE